MKRLILTSLLLIVALAVSQPVTQAQGKKDKNNPPKVSLSAEKAAAEFGNVEGISAAQIKDFLAFIAADELEGRDTPSRGLDIAAKFIAFNLARWGYKPAGDNGTFFQNFGLRQGQIDKDQTKVELAGQTFKAGEDFIPRPTAKSASGQMVFVGHGMVIKAKNINAYEGIDVKDKIIVVSTGLPKGVQQNELTGKLGEDFESAYSYAAKHGAKGIVNIPRSIQLTSWDASARQAFRGGRVMLESAKSDDSLPEIVVSAKLLNAIFQGEAIDGAEAVKQADSREFAASFALKADKKITLDIKGNPETLPTQNVVAIWEGSDPTLKEEYLAIGCHYDHVGVQPESDGGKTDGWSRYKAFLNSAGRLGGTDKLWNGADDDGSGTVAVLAMAEALAKGTRPKRSVLLVWHAGEEKGLWGSDYVTDHPPVPAKQIIAQLNIDMIGRSKKEGDTNRSNSELSGPNEIYVIGSKMMSSYLAEVSEQVNNSYLKLSFNYKYDDPNDRNRFFFRSDHYNYARKGIPIIFYFDGVHEDYHRPTDHPDKIDYEKMEKVTRTIFATMWKLANSATRPKVDQPLPPQLRGN
ncbi:MAG: M28 family peptidase [Acidobacteriota bacterium]|nr:M28 family peptidase [Acidobacteriota bacterium]